MAAKRMLATRILSIVLPATAATAAAAPVAPPAPEAGGKEVRIRLGEPIVVSRAPVGERRWGQWQFPGLERLRDGRLHVTWHAAPDNAAAYGATGRSAVSPDEGRTWTLLPPGEAERLAGGVPLPGGDRLRLLQEKPVPLQSLALPEPAGEAVNNYGNVAHKFYRVAGLPEEVRRSWPQARLAAGGTTWTREYPVVDIPGQLATARDGVLARPFFMGCLLPAPDGSLWTSCYWQRLSGGEVSQFLPTFVRSADQGRTWTFMSDIPYLPDQKADARWNRRDGFTEPELAFLPDGSVLAILRTTDGAGHGPLYIARSTDGGKSWSRPEVFDSLGVLPQLLVMKGGVTLSSYGRPGVYLRATADRSGRNWGARVEVPLHKADWARWGPTCGYTRLLPLDANSALLVYSDFAFPDEDGRPRKTILVRKVTVEWTVHPGK